MRNKHPLLFFSFLFLFSFPFVIQMSQACMKACCWCCCRQYLRSSFLSFRATPHTFYLLTNTFSFQNEDAQEKRKLGKIFLKERGKSASVSFISLYSRNLCKMKKVWYNFYDIKYALGLVDMELKTCPFLAPILEIYFIREENRSWKGDPSKLMSTRPYFLYFCPFSRL